MRLGSASALAASLFGAAVPSVHAADHSNLEEALPITIEDAYPIAYGGRELQALVRYDRTPEGEDRTVIEPRLEWGAVRNGQFKLTVPFKTGSADDTNSGDVRLEALYNFNQETVFLPALALSIRADAPTGEDSEGVDTAVKVIASKLVGRTNLFQAVHINVSWLRNDDPQLGERDDYYAAAIGYTARLNPDTLLVTDLVREEEKEQGMTTKLAEIGVRRQITPLLVLAAAAGVGLDDDSPDYRATLAFQYGFGGPGPRDAVRR